MQKITINDILNKIDGIGVSKSQYRNKTGLTSENKISRNGIIGEKRQNIPYKVIFNLLRKIKAD